MKLRPERYRDLDEELWRRIEVFREIVDERSRATRSLSERGRELLGLSTRFSDTDEIRSELFEGVNLPDAVADAVDEAFDHLDAHDVERARGLLLQEFGSDCDATPPAEHTVDEAGRLSRCHRHLSDHGDPRSRLDREVFGGSA